MMIGTTEMQAAAMTWFHIVPAFWDWKLCRPRVRVYLVSVLM